MASTAAAAADSQEPDVPIPVDDEDESSYETASNSTTQSITSSVQDYVFENGRRYHRYGKEEYFLPNDETEQDRLDMYHHVRLLELGGRLHTAPISDSPQRILDVGTGTGIWAIDIASEYPSAEVIGTDLSPIQPKWVPPNVRFEVDDASLDWTFLRNHFDFIHSRDLAQSIKDWPRYIEQMYEHTAPGGYVELVETGPRTLSDDNTIPPGCALEVYMDGLEEGLTKSGIPLLSPPIFKTYLEDAGFLDVKVITTKVPWGTWPKNKTQKEMGAFLLVMLGSGMEAYGLALFTRVLGMSTEDATKLCRDALAMIKDRKVHAYVPTYHAYGRKPEAEPKETTTTQGNN